MPNIPIRDIPVSGVPSASSKMVFDDGQMKQASFSDAADAIRPVASQSEAQTGSDNVKTMTPLRTKESLASEVGSTIQAYSPNLSAFAGKSAPSGDVVGTSDAQTITNKTIDGDNNTISDVALTSLKDVADKSILSNISGSSGSPAANGLSAIIDAVFGSTQGAIITRKASGWGKLDPGASGTFLTSQGGGNDIKYSAIPGGGGALPVFDTFAQAEAYSPATAPEWIKTAFYDTDQVKGSGGTYSKNGETTGDLVITLDDGVTEVGYDLATDPTSQYMFGAKGDGVTDDTNALKAWIAHAKATGAYPRGVKGDHVISDTIQITIDADLSQLHLLHAAANGTVACRVGRRQATGSVVSVDDAWSRTIKTPKLTNTNKVAGSGWTGFTTAVGLEIATANNNEIYVNDVENFGVGLALAGYDNDGCAYNNVFLKAVAHNRTNVRIQPGGTTGWSNENNIFGGRLTHWSGDVVSGTTDIEISCYPGNAFEPNNNLFIKPSIEGDNTEVVALIQGRVNKIINPRIDRSTPGYIGFISDFDGQTTGNEIEGGYGLDNLTIGFLGGHTAPGNTIRRAGFVSVHGSGGAAIAVTNQVTDGPTAAHIVGYPAGTNVITKDDTSSDYVYNLHAKGLEGKRTGDTGVRASLDFHDGRLTLSNGAGADVYLETSSGALVFTGNLFPSLDATYQLGTGSERLKTIYAEEGTINTSDSREKKWRGLLSEAELRVAKRLSKLIGVYQWLEAIEKKGDAARLHVGVTAQAVKEAFEAEGLDGFRYGLLCFDKWEAQPAVLDKDGKVIRPAREAGERYGVRYEQLWAFVAAGFEARLSLLESKAEIAT